MKTTILVTLISLLTVVALPGHAENTKENSAMRDAWLDGKLDTVILLNRDLNPFKIDSGVTNGVAVLSGEVDSNVEKSLATELAKGIDGISDVKNHLQVKPKQRASDSDSKKETSNVTDAAITVAISTKLLLNTEINSTEIDVDTDNAKVKLSGTVDNRAERDLVEQIAKNTFEVTSVTNNLAIEDK